MCPDRMHHGLNPNIKSRNKKTAPLSQCAVRLCVRADEPHPSAAVRRPWHRCAALSAAQIIDMMILVVNVLKGIQTQTAECLVIGEICTRNLIVVLNKVPSEEAA